MRIPLVDLYAQYLSIKDEIDAAMAAVIETSAYVKGPFVERFERAFADFLGVGHCVGVGNGTDALVIALKGLGVGPGDEVITAVNTFVATPEAISLAGARPVFCDVDEETMNLDPERIEERVTDRTRAIIPIHLYGRMAAMEQISALARRHDLLVVEDAAQAHGACLAERAAGAWGHAAAFSFYPGKNLGAYGDAGAVVTPDRDLADHVRRFANHGRATKYGHEFEGLNSRLDGLQAAVLAVKLSHLDRWCERRREIAAIYRQGLTGIDGLLCPDDPEDGSHVFHLFVVRSPERDALAAHLRKLGIATGIHYPQTMADLPAYRDAWSPEADFPVATRLRREILSLPLYPEMGRGEIDAVIDAVRRFYGVA